MSTPRGKDKRKRRKPAKKPGPKSLLTDDLLSQIKDGIIQGHTHAKIQADLKIAKSTWDQWINLNYEHFRDKLLLYKHEYKLRLAEVHLEKVLNMETMEPVIGMFGPIMVNKKPLKHQNDRILKIKTDVATFVAETIGKKTYSKKVEIDDITKKKRVLID